MEDGEGFQDFDFEQGLDTRPAVVTPSPVPNGAGLANVDRRPYRRNFRQTVCRHWLRGLCMKGNDCGFLHQYDKSRMPVCRFFAKWGECREPDCFFKHTNEDVKECNMYKLGFCPNGPECRYRHLKLPGPAPPPEQHLPRVQHRVYQNGNYYRQRHTDNQEHGSHEGSLLAGQGLLQDMAVPAESGLRGDQISSVHQTEGPRIQEEQSQPKLVGQETAATPPPQHSPVQDFASDSVPLPGGVARYFIVKSNNIENLDLSVKRGLWATHRNNESRLNEAYDKCDNVILIFSVNETRHFQGCAKMMSKIGGAVVGAGWKYANGTAHYGRNFRIKWLKLCQLSFQKTRHLRNPYNEDLPVKISRDCQELEPGVGQQLARLLYLEPDSELMALAKVTESNWEAEESKNGIAGRPEVEDTKIVPFEDGESEEESSEEEEEEEDFANNNNRNQMGPMGRGQWYGGRGRPLPGRGAPYGMPPQGIPPPGDTFRMGPGNPSNGFGGIIPPEEAFGGGNMMAGPGPSFPPFRPIRPGFQNGRPDFPRPDFPGPHFNGPDFPGRNFPRPDFAGNDFLPRPPPFSGTEFGTEFARPDFPGPGFPGQEFGGIPGPGGMGEVFGPRRGGGGYPGMGPRVRNNMGFRGSRPMFPPGGPGGFMGPEGPMGGWAGAGGGGGGGGGGVLGGSNGPPFMGPGGPGLQQPFVGGERGGHGGLQGGGIRPPMPMGRGGVAFRSIPPNGGSGGSGGRGSAGRESPASGEEAGDNNNNNNSNNNATTTTTVNNNNNANRKTQHRTAHNSTEDTERHHTSSQSLGRRRFEEEEGVSEDEAPRRSRHKRRKAWEEEEDEEEMRWDDYVEGADPWEAARQAETGGNTNGEEDNNVDY